MSKPKEQAYSTVAADHKAARISVHTNGGGFCLITVVDSDHEGKSITINDKETAEALCYMLGRLTA